MDHLILPVPKNLHMSPDLANCWDAKHEGESHFWEFSMLYNSKGLPLYIGTDQVTGVYTVQEQTHTCYLSKWQRIEDLEAIWFLFGDHRMSQDAWNLVIACIGCFCSIEEQALKLFKCPI